MHLITNGYKCFSKTNSTGPRQCVPLIGPSTILSWERRVPISVKINPSIGKQTALVGMDRWLAGDCATFKCWESTDTEGASPAQTQTLGPVNVVGFCLLLAYNPGHILLGPLPPFNVGSMWRSSSALQSTLSGGRGRQCLL